MNSLADNRRKAEILRRLTSVRPDSARRWGRMSAHQMVCHLSDSFRMAMGERRVSDATGPFQRTIVKWMALFVPVPWPKAITTRPEIDQEVGGTCPGDFTADVAELEALVALVAAREGNVKWATTHPIFGRMSKSAWLRWAYLHMDHHLRQFGA
jgi:Protein of unknown function (DUF1569)